jgi:hypothetical protein
MEWQKGYKPDSSSSWTWDPPEAGGAPRVLNTSTPGIYSYRARNCKDYDCTDCNWVQSPDANVVDVDKVVKEGTTDEGALYVCVGEDVNLEALPDPCGASFPEDQPTWYLGRELHQRHRFSCGSMDTVLVGSKGRSEPETECYETSWNSEPRIRTK